MDRGDLETLLMKLGLDEDEARAYIQLYLCGPCKAGAIADALNVHQTKGYWAMENLVKKGFAVEMDSSPTRYRALDPCDMAASMQERAQSRIDEIDRIRDRIAAPLEELRHTARDEVPSDTYRLVRGRPPVVDLLQRAFETMEDELLVFSDNPWAHVTRESYPSLWETAVERADEGVAVRAIFHTNAEMRQELTGLLEVPTIEVRHLPASRHRPFVVADRDEILYWLVTDPSTRSEAEDEVAVWSNAEGFVAENVEVFTTRWEAGSDLGEMVARDGERAAPDGD